MTSKHLSELVELVLAGQKEAFEQLYNATIDDVYRTLYLLSGSERDAEDIAQNVYLELYKSLDKYDRSRSLHGWLYGITIRQLQTFKRKRWREYRKEQKERETFPGKLKPFDDASYEHIIEDQADLIIVELDKLPDKLKQVLVLRYINDLSQQEIADIVGIPLGTVKSRLNQALVRMRHKIRREEHAEY